MFSEKIDVLMYTRAWDVYEEWGFMGINFLP